MISLLNNIFGIIIKVLITLFELKLTDYYFINNE